MYGIGGFDFQKKIAPPSGSFFFFMKGVLFFVATRIEKVLERSHKINPRLGRDISFFFGAIIPEIARINKNRKTTYQ